jgi:AraC family transcriptional regulator
VFQYRGDYAHIGRAFDAVFRGWVSEAGVALRPAPCLEIYVDNARGVAPRDRVTELCVPVER